MICIKSMVFTVLLLLTKNGWSQSISLDTATVRKELIAIHDRDQSVRKSNDAAFFRQSIDSANLSQVEQIIDQYGWLGKSIIGAKANQALFLVIQHADLATQEKYLPLMEKSVLAGESRAVDWALLQDRVLMRQGKKQRFGSQVVFNATGEQVFYPIEDEAHVNARRDSVGLQPIEEYAKYFSINYTFPKE